MISSIYTRFISEVLIPILIICTIPVSPIDTWYNTPSEPQPETTSVVETVDVVMTETDIVEEVVSEPEQPESSEPDEPVEPVVKTPTVTATDIAYSDSDIELLALVTIAEAEGECELGKRLVIDTVLNRVDSDRFGDSIYSVIYAKGAFSSMWNGRADRCVVTDYVRNLVREEMASRTNSQVLYFRMSHYHSFGTPLFQVGCHYFSTI